MHVAVTGASAGIGEAFVREFARQGARITLVARREDKMRTIADELDTQTFVAAQDLATPEACCDWIEPATQALGPIDVLINNAGMQIIGQTHQVDTEWGETLLKLNVFAPLRLTRAVLPQMLERGSGTIVDIASMAALAPTPGMFYYNASKGALAAASEALRGELRGSGVHVVTVYPGIIMTDMGEAGYDAYEESTMLRWQPRGTTQKLAALTCRAVHKQKARVIYPRMNVLARWFPTITRWVMDRLTPPLKQGSS
jgi:short-subunit dehydrogenase